MRTLFTFPICVNTCIADHHKVIRGPFAKLRSKLWWKIHDNCNA